MVILFKELQPSSSLYLLSGWLTLLVVIAQSMLRVCELALVRVYVSTALEVDFPFVCLLWWEHWGTP